MHWWVVAIVAIVVLVYCSYYYKYPEDLTVLQTSLTDFQFDMLRAKQPIVIHDRVADAQQVRKAWFPYNIVKTTDVLAFDAWTSNRYKYLMIQPTAQATDVYLYGAREPLDSEGLPDAEKSLLAIHLEPKQLLILPRGMRYMIEKQEFIAYGIHDWVSMWLP